VDFDILGVERLVMVTEPGEVLGPI
jgi:hypothetical protein